MNDTQVYVNFFNFLVNLVAPVCVLSILNSLIYRELRRNREESAAGLRRSPTELLLECVAVLHGVSFTSHDCSEAAARAARTLWYADRSDLLPWRSVM